MANTLLRSHSNEESSWSCMISLWEWRKCHYRILLLVHDNSTWYHTWGILDLRAFGPMGTHRNLPAARLFILLFSLLILSTPFYLQFPGGRSGSGCGSKLPCQNSWFHDVSWFIRLHTTPQIWCCNHWNNHYNHYNHRLTDMIHRLIIYNQV